MIMTREESKAFYPILQAFAEGKVIECRTKPSALSKSWQDMNEWTEMKEIEFWNNTEYRVKPKPKYRPFKDAEECWKEMLKHQPFGWVKFQCDWFLVVHIDDKSIGYGSACGVIMHSKFDDILKSFTFADGTPFGMKEED